LAGLAALTQRRSRERAAASSRGARARRRVRQPRGRAGRRQASADRDRALAGRRAALRPEGRVSRGPAAGSCEALRTGLLLGFGPRAPAARRPAPEWEPAGRLRDPGETAPGRGDRRPRGPRDARAEEPCLPGVAALRPERRPADEVEPAGAERGRVPDPRPRRRDRAPHAALG